MLLAISKVSREIYRQLFGEKNGRCSVEEWGNNKHFSVSSALCVQFVLLNHFIKQLLRVQSWISGAKLKSGLEVEHYTSYAVFQAGICVWSVPGSRVQRSEYHLNLPQFENFDVCVLVKVCLDCTDTNINASQAEQVESNGRVHLQSCKTYAYPLILPWSLLQGYTYR